MALSKARMKARKRKDRLSNLVKPKVDALQSTARPLEEKSNGKLPIQPNDTLRQPAPLRDVETRASGGAYEEPLEYVVGAPVKPELDADGEPIPELT